MEIGAWLARALPHCLQLHAVLLTGGQITGYPALPRLPHPRPRSPAAEVAAELPLLEPLELGVKAEEDLAAAEPQDEAAPPAGPLDDLQALLAGEAPSWLTAPSKQEADEQPGEQQQQEQQQEQQQQQQQGAADAEMADAEAAGDAAAAPAADGAPAPEPAAADPSQGGADAGAPSDAAAAGEDGPPGEDDALAADLLSNMAAWQSELDTFTVSRAAAAVAGAFPCLAIASRQGLQGEGWSS